MTPKTLLAVAPACLFLSACGSNGGSPSTTAKDPDAARVRMAQCMRKAGVQATADPGGGMRMRVPNGMNPERMEKIQKDCTKSSGMPEPQAPSPEVQAEIQDAALKFAACMRKNGVKMPDPEFDGGRITQKIERGANPSQPLVQKAQKICEKLMPKLKGGPMSSVEAGDGKSGGSLSGP